MENQKRVPVEQINPVSRKTNEEIDEDEVGNLIIDGKYTEEPKSVPTDGPISEDLPKDKRSLNK
ncbi:hypothetical protein [Pedobacter boryungensis]|uniref:Uncharacterized protein n=1 Tax=Pedobacter boryungensis TaxID=869962 RepID=A0ABX2DCC8_9SPHI|nr:hypothetical protein [Pedobacter boryungensis]NQX30656.1 hypothetical protein [Pedobacter boryungensis]